MSNPYPLLPCSFWKGIAIPLALWILFTPFSKDLDQYVSHLFYSNNQFSQNPFWQFVYTYATWPALLVASFAGLLFLFYSIFKKRFKHGLTVFFVCGYLIFTLGIGSGLIVHYGLKDHWGRPRPKQTTEFGGDLTFRPYYSPNFHSVQPSKSFSCGHCSVGFYFFSFMMLGIYFNSRKIYWFGLITAFSLGIILSLARIAQGGHFLSDTLASALIMWLTAWILGYAFALLIRNENERINS